MNVPTCSMARYGMGSNEISIFGLEFESEDDLPLEGGVDPPFQTLSLERHLQASVSMPIFQGPHGIGTQRTSTRTSDVICTNQEYIYKEIITCKGARLKSQYTP
jgi:hypothetical protein